jgi:methyl-accepting chemotaxis protein
MTLDIHWTLTVNVPQLDTLVETLVIIGDKVMADLQGIKDAIVELTTQQADGSQALADQLTVIADEISQLNAESLDQAELDALAQQIRDAAATAQAGADQVRANSAQIAGMVPDEPPAPPSAG